jgi:chorismate mutase/prephenate dehydratase
MFFVDLEGYVEDPKVKKALQLLGEYCQEVTVLGSYPMALTSG